MGMLKVIPDAVDEESISVSSLGVHYQIVGRWAALFTNKDNSSATVAWMCQEDTFQNYQDIMNTLAVGLQAKWILKE